MASRIILDPETLLAQAGEMQNLTAEYEALFSKVTGTLNDTNNHWSELLAHNFAGKISSAQQSFASITELLSSGAVAAKNSATTMQSVDQSLVKVFGGEAGAGISSGQVQGVIDVIEDYRKAEKTSKKVKAKSKKKKDSFLDSLKADVAGVSKAVIKKGKKTVAKIKKSYDEKGFVYKALQYGKAAVKVGEGVIKIAGAVALVAGSGGAALPVATCLALSACNDVYNAMMDATYTYTGDYNKIGNTNLLKEFLVKQGRETGEALFGDKKLGEKMGNWVYTGLDIVSFLNGVDQLGKSFGKFQTAITGTAGTSKVWGEIHMKDVIENTHKLYKKDGIIKTVLRIDPTSVGNFGYDVVTGAMKAIQSAGKLGSTIADLAFGKRRKENKMAKQLLPNGSVVTLKGATKKLMTIGIEVEMEGDEKTYDYIAIPYPEGYIDSETMFLFMQEDIENVSFVGFVDAQLQVFRTALEETDENDE